MQGAWWGHFADLDARLVSGGTQGREQGDVKGGFLQPSEDTTASAWTLGKSLVMKSILGSHKPDGASVCRKSPRWVWGGTPQNA